jgi:hypothetical protein
MNKMRFYNKVSIVVFSIFLTGVGAALMFGYNIRKAGKSKLVVPLVLITLVAYGVLRMLLKQIFPGSLFEFLLPNLILGFLLAFPVWNKYLGEFDYESKIPWIPTGVAVLLWGLMAINFFHVLD